MEIVYSDNLPHVLIIKNFYSEEEVNTIWKELETVHLMDKTQSKKIGGAESEHGPLKKAIGKWIYYEETPDNELLKISHKVKNHADIFTEYSDYYKDLKLDLCVSNVLISYYSNGGFYKPHTDFSYITACSYFFKEPKKFSGGNFLIKQREKTYVSDPSKFDADIEIENNMIVIFPGHYLHQAKKVEMNSKDFGYGRYCISQFYNVFKRKEND